jgi:ADP-ribosylglycohydrolase
MALYLAEAVLGHGPFGEERFGLDVGEAFSRWLDDPLTPLTAPGNTCIAGVRNWRRTRDWRTSGVSGSDGCGAVMRVAPLAIFFGGEDLDRAAAVSARITHGHPDAAAAAVAACRLHGAALARGRFDAALVAEVADGLPGTDLVIGALRAALAQASAPADGWLDERAIPPGDGGWRAPSALGLAVAAALRWGGDFALAVERAARIDGDSDSVAAIAGMFLGAAGGRAVLPPAWLAAVKDRERIEEIAGWLAFGRRLLDGVRRIRASDREKQYYVGAYRRMCRTADPEEKLSLVRDLMLL